LQLLATSCKPTNIVILVDSSVSPQANTDLNHQTIKARMKLTLFYLITISGASGFQLHPPCRVATSRALLLSSPVARIQHQNINKRFPCTFLKMSSDSDGNGDKDDDLTDSMSSKIDEEVENIKDGYEDSGVKGKVEEVADGYEDSGLKGKVEEIAAKVKVVSPEKIEGRKKRVIAGYKILVAGYLAFGAIICAISRKPFYGAGPLLASGVSYSMIGAAENSRLSSDTYKRLNIGLFEFGVTGFLAGILMKLSPVWALTCFITVVNSVKGYGYGLKGWELGDQCVKEEIKSGMKTNIGVLTKVPNPKSAFYLAGTLAVGTFKLVKLSEIFNIIKASGSNYVLGTRLFRLSKLMLLTVIMFTLKDAADRDRLEGTTFIELNALASITFGTWAFSENLFSVIGGFLGFASAFTAFNAISSQTKKNKKT